MKENSNALWVRTCDHVNAKIHPWMKVTVSTDCAMKQSASYGIREDIIICYRLFSIILFTVTKYTLYNPYSINLYGY